MYKAQLTTGDGWTGGGCACCSYNGDKIADNEEPGALDILLNEVPEGVED